MTATRYYSFIDSPLGRICVQGNEQFLTGLSLPAHKHWRGLDTSWQELDAPFNAVRQQLAEYFAGERQQFDIPLLRAIHVRDEGHVQRFLGAQRRGHKGVQCQTGNQELLEAAHGEWTRS